MAGASTQSVWRRGHVYWFEPTQILADFFTLGVIERPWDRARLGPTGAMFAYYDVEEFDPEGFRTSYPNPAFGRMTERDAAWMARIIARISSTQLEAMARASGTDQRLRERLVEILLGRRRKLLRRYLERLSPLADPTLVADGTRTWLCMTDLGARARSAAAGRKYSTRIRSGPEPAAQPVVALRSAHVPCVLLPSSARRSLPERDYRYWVLELRTQDGPKPPYPARVHLYERGPGDYLVAGLERPESDDTPD
jgi:hypothetical protein